MASELRRLRTDIRREERLRSKRSDTLSSIILDLKSENSSIGDVCHRLDEFNTRLKSLTDPMREEPPTDNLWSMVAKAEKTKKHAEIIEKCYKEYHEYSQYVFELKRDLLELAFGL